MNVRLVIAALLVPVLVACSGSTRDGERKMVIEGEISAEDLAWVKEQAMARDLTPIEGVKPVVEKPDWVHLPVEAGTCYAVFVIRASGSRASLDVTNQKGVLIGEHLNPFALKDDPDLQAKCK